MAQADLTIAQLNLPDLNDKLGHIAGRMRALDALGRIPWASVVQTAQTANTVFAAPDAATATKGEPSFRALTSTDIPALDASKITTGKLALARGGTHADLSATGGANMVLKQSSVGGDVTVGTLDAASIASGQLALARGGTHADLSATGGAGKVLKQTTVGGNVSVATLVAGDVPDVALTSNVGLLNRNSQTWTGSPQIFTGLIESESVKGALSVIGSMEEEITLDTTGATTDSTTNLLGPLGTLTLGVAYRVTEDISGGGVTKISVGDATTTDRFIKDSTFIVAGNTVTGMRHWQGGVTTDAAGPVQVALAKIRITADGTPTQGKIRVTTFYLQTTAATS